MVTGSAGHYHVTGGELQSQRERENVCVCVISSSDRCKSFALDLRARNCGRQLSRRICVTNCLSICVSNRVCILFQFCVPLLNRTRSFVFFLDLSCFVLLSCVFFFSFF
jgi:hypothetical protein